MNKSLIISFLLLIFANIGNGLRAQCNPDVEAPTAVCAASHGILLQAGQPATLLAAALDAGSFDNCSASPQLEFRIEDGATSATPPPGTSLVFDESGIGTHHVTLWVLDEAGNASHCSSTVYVNDFCNPSSATVVCASDLPVSVMAGETVTLYPGALLEGGPYCNTYQLTLNPPGTGSDFIVFDETDLGTHIVSVTDLATGNACWSTVQVVSGGPCTSPDVVLPMPVCKHGLVFQIPPGQAAELEIFATDLDGGSYDNCTQPALLEYRVEATDLPSSQPPATESTILTGAGVHDLVLWIGDEAGNWAYCQTTVLLNDCTSSAILACNDNMTLEITSSQPVNFYPEDMLEGGPYCYDQMVIGNALFGTPQPFMSFGPNDAGSYTLQVTYLPTGNSCWGTLQVVNVCTGETIPPIAVCDQNIVVELSQDGPDLTYIEAQELNSGSSDNCTAPIDLQFAIEAGPPSASMPSTEQLAFTAVGTYPNVVMWVADLSGNTNICWVEITVIPPKCSPDLTPPACIAPADTVISSDALVVLNLDPQNFQQMDNYFGGAYAWDACGLDTVLQSSLALNNACNLLKTLTRTFIAIDQAGNTSTCQQVVQVAYDFSINIPKDFLPGDATVEELSYLQGNGTSLSTSYEDEIFLFNCDTIPDLIERTWKVTNWCEYEVNQPAVSLPRLDTGADGQTGDNYVAWCVADTVFQLDNGLPVATIAQGDGLYQYKQLIRYNYDDTLQLSVAGSVFMDTVANCIMDTAEPGLSGWPVKAVGQTSGRTYVATTTAGGVYQINGICASDTEVEVSLDVPFNYGQNCPTTWLVNTVQGMPAVQHIPVHLDNSCPLMTVDLASPFLRRCFSNTYTVSYCNYSAQLIENAWVEVALDTFMEYLSSSIPGAALGNNVFSFQVGDLQAGQCGSFTIVFDLSCDAVLGQTHCSEAHIYPDTLCPESPFWSGANIEVEGFCENDTVRLTIKNTGNGDMPAPLDYIVVEDVIMYLQGNFQLDAGQTQPVTPIPATGQTWRLEAEQVPNHPYPGSVAVAVEGCNGLNMTGLVNLFCMENPNPFISVDCQENIGSFDPNDKSAAPLGYGEHHLIERNTDIEYLIRFQNTGTDTAFKVVILDTLSAYLDPVSLRPGIGSHPFSFEMLDEKTLRFTFNGILLPDSTTNEPASHGFVKFSAKQLPGISLGTLIENSAAIYFDFNEPIITNTVFHTIGENFIEVTNDAVERPSAYGELLVYPNPSSGHAIFDIPGATLEDGTFVLRDHQGRLIKTERIAGNRFRFDRGALVPGIYFYLIENAGTTLYTGKIILR